MLKSFLVIAPLSLLFFVAVVAVQALLTKKIDNQSEIAVQAIAGEIVKVPVRIIEADLDTIMSVKMSCGCTRLLDSDGEAVKFPFTVPAPHANLQIEVNTTGKIGKNEMVMAISGRKRERLISKKFTTTIECLPGFILVPDIVRHTDCRSGEVFESEVQIMRHVDAKTLKVEEHIVDSSGDMQFEILNDEETSNVIVPGFILVETCKLKYTAGQNARHDFFTVTAINGNVRGTVQVVTEPVASRLSVAPSTVHMNEGATSSTIWISHADRDAPTVPSPPQGYKVSIDAARIQEKGLFLTKAIIQRVDDAVVNSEKEQVNVEFFVGGYSASVLVIYK